MTLTGNSVRSETAWRRKLVLRLVPLVLVLITGMVAWRLATGEWFPLEASLRSLVTAQDYARQNGLWFVAVFAGAYTIAVAFSVPIALPLTITGGFLLGWVPGALIAIGAKTFGSLFLFLIARFGFSDLASRHAGPRLAAIERYIRSDSFFYVLFMRIQPMVPFFLVNLAAALFEVRTRVFVIATAVGVAPGAFISSYAGVGVNDMLQANLPLFDLCRHGNPAACNSAISFAALWSPKAFIALVLLALLALIPVIGRRWLKISLPSA